MRRTNWQVLVEDVSLVSLTMIYSSLLSELHDKMIEVTFVPLNLGCLCRRALLLPKHSHTLSFSSLEICDAIFVQEQAFKTTSIGSLSKERKASVDLVQSHGKDFFTSKASKIISLGPPI